MRDATTADAAAFNDDILMVLLAAPYQSTDTRHIARALGIRDFTDDGYPVLRDALTRLRKKGFISYGDTGKRIVWTLTLRGIERAERVSA